MSERKFPSRMADEVLTVSSSHSQPCATSSKAEVRLVALVCVVAPVVKGSREVPERAGSIDVSKAPAIPQSFPFSGSRGSRRALGKRTVV
jgi:hypothetical protein